MDVRRVITLVLSHANYGVVCPRDAAETLAMCADAEVALLIVDATWAGDFDATIALMWALRPDLPVLLIGEGQRQNPAGPPAHVTVLRKPFTPAELLHFIGVALGDAR